MSTLPKFQTIPIGELHPAADNLRAEVGDVTELAASITTAGILEPLIVAVTERGTTRQKFTVVTGHRRLAAAKLAGLITVPAIVCEFTDRQRVEAMLIENLQREDLTPLEEAGAYRRLTELGLGQVQLALRVGRSQAHVSKRLALLKLPEAAQAALDAGVLPIADALDLVPFAAPVIAEVLKRIAQDTRDGRQLYPGAVKRAAAQAAQELEEAQARATALAGLTAAKVSILKVDQYGRPAGRVHELGKGWDRIPMTPSAHKKHGCHAAYVDGRGGIHYVCTKPSTHVADPSKAVAKAAKEITGAVAVAGGKDVKRAAAAKRKAGETRERNKALRAAAPARRKLIAGLVKPAKVPAGVLDFTLRQLVQTFIDHAPAASAIAGELLGIKSTDRAGRPNFKPLASSSAGVARIAYALALAAGEQPFAQLVGRGYFDEEFSSHAARHFAHLRAAGYKPTVVELRQIKPSGWRKPFDGAGGK